MNEFKVDESLPPLEQENQVLRYFQANWTTNPKKLVKLAKKITPGIPAFIQRSIIHNVCTAKYPVKFLEEAFREMGDLPILMKQLRDEGNHGMIMDDNKIYGIEIKANPKWLRENDKWNPDDEDEIINSVVEGWMEEQKIKAFIGKVLLFHECGFSGIPRKVHQEFTKEFFASLTEQGVSSARVEQYCEQMQRG
jgi:hypothetical protein